MRRSQPDVGAILGEALEAGAVVMTPVIELELLRTARDVREHAELSAEYGALRRVGVADSVACERWTFRLPWSCVAITAAHRRSTFSPPPPPSMPTPSSGTATAISS